MIRLECLGGLTLESDDVVIPASAVQRRRLALLVLLARSKTGMTRDVLMALLWPEATAHAARHALDQLLYATRRDLGRGALISDGAQLRLAPEVISSDVAEFEKLLHEGRLPAACELNKGPFLDGVHLGDSAEFEHWVDVQRASLDEKLLHALEHLAQHASEPKDAVHWWKRRMAVDPFDADSALALMQAYVAAGEAVAARRFGDSYCARLLDEVGAAPSPAIAAYLAQLAPERKPTVFDVVLPRSLRTRRIVWWPVAATVVLLLVVGARAVSHVPTRQHVPEAAAQQLYLRGRMSWDTRSREGLEQAVVMFRRAVERDPLHAAAYAGMAEAYAMLGYHGFMPAGAAFPKAKAAAQQALSLEPKLGAAHTALGVELQWERRWREAEQELQRAIAYAPNYATAHQHYALLLKTLKRNNEAVAHARRAVELDPLSIQISNTYAIVLAGIGALDSALSIYRRIVTDEPDTAWVRKNPWVSSNFGSMAAADGQYDVAIALINRAIEAVPGHPRPIADLANIHVARGDTAGARRVFARSAEDHPLYAAYRGFFYARVGNVDSAFVWFDRVPEWSPMLLMKLSLVPASSELYADPRFIALLRRFGLPR